MSDHTNGPEVHWMTTYDTTGAEVVSVCQCWYGRSHLGEAIPGHPVVEAATSAVDLTAKPGHQTWSAASGCACGVTCPSIEYWRAHIESLENHDDQDGGV
jgi:hypothetical protein